MRELIKKELESYWYDGIYYAEKIKEIEIIINDISRITLQEQDFENSFMFNNNKKLLKRLTDRLNNDQKIFDDLFQKKQKTEISLGKMSQPYKTIMYLKYIMFNTFDEIAVKMCYSPKRIYQLHSIALDLFVEICSDLDQDEIIL